MDTPLHRFLEAQEKYYEIAIAEIKTGKKQSHWMWFIFPQIAGLGSSEVSKKYAIQDFEEARVYLAHPVLGQRLREITQELLKLNETNAEVIFGVTDAMKLKSCMTLFARTYRHRDNIFKDVINKFFGGNFDRKTFDKIMT